MKRFFRLLTVVTLVVSAAVLGLTAYGAAALPDRISAVGGSVKLGAVYSAVPEDAAALDVFSGGATETDYSVRLLGVIPVKTVRVNVTERKYLALGGQLVGLRLKTEGVLVLGTEPFRAKEGGEADPAGEAGIKKGDTLLSVDGIRIDGNDMLTQTIADSEGRTLTLTVRRGDETLTLYLTPRRTAATGLYKGGLWVRDSTVGVGTVTFCDMETQRIAALGHGVYDTDTESLLNVANGEICTATVSSVKKGTPGTPGEITGSIGDNTVGSVTLNCEEGLFGELYYMDGAPELYPMATASEVHTGKAKVICTVEGGEKRAYDITIKKLEVDDPSRNMTIRITDPALLERTGGIVQGMSGSPVVQDGLLVGAVTHVFVNDPKSGYGIFAENMLNAMR